jgi:hypothetical protein
MNILFRTILGLGLFFITAATAAQSLFPHMNDSRKWGYSTPEGKILIPCEYDEAWPFFSTGKAVVKKEGKYGMIDKKGKTVIAFDYEKILPALPKDKLMAAEKGKNKNCGFLDEEGTEVISCDYNPFYLPLGAESFFYGGFASEGEGNGRIDSSGLPLLLSKYQHVGMFEEGMAPVMNNGKIGFINKKGKLVIPTDRYKGNVGNSFNEGLAALEDSTGKHGFIDSTGKVVIRFRFRFAWGFSDGLARVDSANFVGYIDKSGKQVLPFKYRHASDFIQGMALVTAYEDRVLIDKTGKEIIQYQPRTQIRYYEGHGIIGIESNDLYGFLNLEKRPLTPLKYIAITELNFGKNYAIVVMPWLHYGCVDTTGREFIPCMYKSVIHLSSNLFCVQDSLFKWGVLNNAGKVIAPCKFESIGTVPVVGMLKIRIRSKEGTGSPVKVREYLNGEVVYATWFEKEGYLDEKGIEHY